MRGDLLAIGALAHTARSATGNRLRHVYFPTTSILSLLHAMEDGASAEIAIVGHSSERVFPRHGDGKRRSVATASCPDDVPPTPTFAT